MSGNDEPVNKPSNQFEEVVWIEDPDIILERKEILSPEMEAECAETQRLMDEIESKCEAKEEALKTIWTVGISKYKKKLEHKKKLRTE